MAAPTNKQLREFILASFNESELGLFCFDHFEEAELYFVDSMPILDRAVALIKYCRRQGRMGDLLRVLAEERPSKYQEMLAPQPPQKQVEPGSNSFIHEKTGLEFVHIPAGEFLFGENNFRIYLPEYWMCKTPVTFAAYQRFIRANPGHPVPFEEDERAVPYNWDSQWRSYPADKVNHPVVFVSWYDAVAFCEWAGLQLPTEEQWEKAARGTDGRIYPWGNNEPTDKLCNFNKNAGGVTPVGQYSPQGDSPYGCVDMGGNVWEWCLNKYEKPEDTTIDKNNAWRVLRGGSWSLNANLVRAAYRGFDLPDGRDLDLGFRVVAMRPSSQDH
jgi:formylglycine-generating enzyme required for sulfatase activity